MPDFEALIKHQQLKQPESNKRLKVVKSSESKTESNNPSTEFSRPKLFYYFLAGFSGSLVATISMLFLYENNLITLQTEQLTDLLKLIS